VEEKDEDPGSEGVFGKGDKGEPSARLANHNKKSLHNTGEIGERRDQQNNQVLAESKKITERYVNRKRCY